jgi:hypothetical protein
MDYVDSNEKVDEIFAGKGWEISFTVVLSAGSESLLGLFFLKCPYILPF